MVIANHFYHWRASQWEEMVTNWGAWLTAGSIIFSHLWLTSLLRSRTGLLLLDLSRSLFKFKICVGKVFSLFYLDMYIVNKLVFSFQAKLKINIYLQYSLFCRLLWLTNSLFFGIQFTIIFLLFLLILLFYFISRYHSYSGSVLVK